MLARHNRFSKLDDKNKVPHSDGKILYCLTLQLCMNYGKKLVNFSKILDTALTCGVSVTCQSSQNYCQ